MKKNFFLTICCAMLSWAAAAQGHLSFKGIPITGSIESFCEQLKDKGFTEIKGVEGHPFFRGDFTDRQAYVGVFSTDDGKNVHSVVVLFEQSGEWDTLADTYSYYKKIYSKKYGSPRQHSEKNPGLDGRNASLMYELYQGRVAYNSLWEVEGGSIELSIQKADPLKGTVAIAYRDSQNMEAKIQKDMEDI